MRRKKVILHKKGSWFSPFLSLFFSRLKVNRNRLQSVFIKFVKVKRQEKWYNFNYNIINIFERLGRVFYLLTDTSLVSRKLDEAVLCYQLAAEYFISILRHSFSLFWKPIQPQRQRRSLFSSFTAIFLLILFRPPYSIPPLHQPV